MMHPSLAFDCRLVSSRPLTPSVREITFERADGAPFAFDPGQWVNLILPTPEGELRRAYSIASPPDGTPRFELAVTLVRGGAGSTYLHSLAEGATLRAIGPQGLFTRDAGDAAPALFVGTGTGIAPFRSMLRAAVAAGVTTPLWLLLGARSPDDILYGDELKGLAHRHPNVRFEVTLSQGGPRWAGRSGYVQAHVPELLGDLRKATGDAEPHAFVCGLDRMVGTVKDLLRQDLALPRKHVHVERYD